METNYSILAGKSNGQTRLAGYSPWGHKESDITERLNVHAHIYLFLQFIQSYGLSNLYKLFIEFLKMSYEPKYINYLVRQSCAFFQKQAI